MKTLAVVIPVYNERDHFPVLLRRVLDTPRPVLPDGSPLERVIVVVDDGSTDGTSDLVRDAAAANESVRAAAHPRNRGKGAAVRTGLAEALRHDADVILIQDADLEYDPAEHAKVLRPILDGRADAVIGSRFLGDTHRVLYYWHFVANRIITVLSNMLTNLNLTDVECCFKAFRREVAENLPLREDRFGVEPEIVARLARLRLPGAPGRRPGRVRIYEVAVSYSGRTYEEGKKIGWRDGVSAIRAILRHNLFP